MKPRPGPINPPLAISRHVPLRRQSQSRGSDRIPSLASLEERVDAKSGESELAFPVFGAIAHFERRLISERNRDGFAAARKRGRKPGRPPPSAETVSTERRLIEAGMTPGQAAH
ncbi:MAG: recombinase family protein [Albidovulum sp.]|nr:recombinase family protein [Albidovulum sp.]